MGTFVVAYSIVWLALALYVARLSIRQRQIVLRAAALQSCLEQAEQVAESCSEIAA